MTTAFYVHHHGHGHRHRARCVARLVDGPVLGLSTLGRPDGWPGVWVTLPPDDLVGDAPVDVDAGGRLHWVPRDRAVRRRAAAMSAAFEDHDVDHVVVDVSVEASVLARLHGLRVTVVAQPGDRRDPAHALGHDLADELLAPWPRKAASALLTTSATPVHHVGAISRFDDRVGTGPDPEPGRVLVLLGSGGHDLSVVEEAAARDGDRRWHLAGPSEASPRSLRPLGWVADVWEELRRAEVVVCHAGLNVVAEVAAARRPAVVLPQERPFDEQRHTARALRRLDLAVVPDVPTPDGLVAAVAAAASRDGAAWARWLDGRADERLRDLLAVRRVTT